MPSHVYHEVDIEPTNDGRYLVGWGMSKGVELDELSFVKLFVQEFTFNTRYEVPMPEVREFGRGVLACLVSSGDNHIYAYELTERGAYNMPKEGDGMLSISIEHYRGESERLALTAMAYALLAESRARAESDWDS